MQKSFEGRPVLEHVCLDVRRGEFFSILGPSGAGKTTLLRLCAGFDHPNSGEIEIDGRPMAGVPPNERPVNMIFQAYALFPHLTVEGNVGFGLDMRRIPRRERDQRIGDTLELLKLERLRHRMPAQLSGGEQQRTAIARALVNRPAVMLLDEPMAALDEPLRQAMLVELKDIQRRVGTTFLCVTHHQDEALAVSDRVAVMRAGRIAQIGSPQDVYEQPATRFVAEFIGRANLVSGTLVLSDEGLPALDAAEIDCPLLLPERVVATALVGRQGTIVVRAECVNVTDSRPSRRGINVCRARVESVHYGGSVWRYTLRLSGQTVWRAAVRNDGTGEKIFAPGSEVFLSWAVNEATFVAESGT